MPRKKQLRITKDNTGETREADSIEQALRQVAKDVKQGKLQAPFTLEFEGPSGLTFTVAVNNEEQAGELTTFGFMF